MENIERLLREHPFLAGLTEDQIAFMVSCAANRLYREDELLFRDGEPARELHLLRRGRVALEMNVPGRGTVELETLEPGDVVGISWVFPPYRWSLDARAVESVVALTFDTECLRGKMEADPKFGFAFSRRLLDRVAQRLERVRMQRVDLYRAEPG